MARPRLALPLIVGLGLLLYFTALGHPMYTFGEPREGVTAIDVVSGRGFILPRDPLVEMPFKPPMMRWLATLFAELAGGPQGLTEFTMRLPSATLGIGGVLVCYTYGAALFEPVVGLVGALMLATSLQYLQAATNARVDMTFAFFLEVAFFEFLLMAEGLTSRWLLLYLAVAGAVLSKGPAGFVLPAAVGIIWSLLERRRPSGLHLVPGLALVALIAGGWYAAAIAIGGSGFVLRQLVNENLFAFFHSSSVGGGHNHSFLWLDVALLAGWMPWSFFLPWVAADLGRKWSIPRFSYFFVWILTVVFFYSLAHQKRGVYLLAIYPALAVLSASYVRRIDAAAPALPRFFSALGVAGGVGFAALGLGQMVFVALTIARPAIVGKLLAAIDITVVQLVDALRAQFIQHAGLVWLLPSLTLLFGLGLVASRARPLQLWGMTVAAITAAIVPAQLFVVPAVANAITLKPFTEESMRLVGDHPVAYLIGLNYEVSFYSRRRIGVVGGTHNGWPDYILADADYYKSHAAEMDDFALALQSGPANLDGTGAMVLLRRLSPEQPPKPVGLR